MTELRYNIDGTVRPETDVEAAERTRPRRGPAWTRPAKPDIPKDEAIARAKKLISFNGKPLPVGHDEKPDVSRRKGEDLWGVEVDRVFFGRGGEASFLRGSAEHDDFKEFYAKYQLMLSKKRKAEYEQAVKERRRPPATNESDLDIARLALVMFEDFQEKKIAAMKEKIEKDRAVLPIKAFEQQIVDMVKNNRVTLIAADTGAGKSTQVPQYLLSAGFDKIVCTQPRRIACYSLARRVSYESLNMYGSEIAYQVRFEGTKTSKTRILFLTEGVLLRQFAIDARLAQYNVIIVDEVHERHITGDFLMGVLKRLLHYREDVHIILMSATINAKLFSEYFNAPVIEIPGRMYPVSIEYMPFEKEDRNLVDDRLYEERLNAEVRESVPASSSNIDAGPYLRIMEKIDQTIPPEERGDLLVFLSGINEITALAEELGAYANFTSTLSVTEQEKVFDMAPAEVRKCILSTNIAETSVTIDGVRFIIDSGKVKEMGYDAAANLSRLSEFWISRSSAKQRAGRAGRTGPGECYRFYSKREYERLNEFPVPEILRMPLEPTLLQIRAYGLGDPRDFDFIERPAETSISYSIARLQDLGALSREELLTPLGRVLAVLPLDVVLGKMLILGSICDLVDPIIVIAAALSVQSPFLRVPESTSDIMEKRRSIQSDHGDPFTLLNMFSEWLRVKAGRKESSRSWCRRHGIEEQRLYEMVKLKEQFEGVMKDYLGVQADYAESDHDDDQDAWDGKRKRRKEKEDRDDPNFRRRKQQKQLLQRQKRLQSSGKRRTLQLEDDMTMNEGEPEAHDVADVSIEALEFELKHDAESLLKRSDTGNLTERDVGLVKLVVCSGLYPHLAVTDDANHARRLSEQVYHTKAKKFVQMHPTSVFSYKPELVQPKVSEPPRHREDGKDTLESLHARTSVSDMLCYLELLETNKPYLTNVMRVPALAACLLFGRSIDVTHDMKHVVIDEWLLLKFNEESVAERIIVLANWLRLAWELVVSRKLENVRHGLREEELPAPSAAIPSMGTAMNTDAVFSGRETPAPRKLSYDLKRPTDWSDLKFVPAPIRRVRRDWEDAVARGGAGEFEDVEAADVVARLSEFLDINVECTVERLKMQEISKMFGYEAYIPEMLSQAIVPAAPYLRYFASEPRLGGKKMRSRLDLPVVVEEEVVEPPITAYVPFGTAIVAKREEETKVPEELHKIDNTAVPVGSQDNTAVASGRKRFACPVCGKVMLFTPVEALKHRKGCNAESSA
ncbi:DEAH (Asp-Glu-Ala-His) box polypeptide 34 [Rhizophlyctis rosea]|uniref:DEAH (Asp-Glu-Ala-His) box polypeptide 34 n=1 Tax=Rhizophlyctis rosea TaxID=64517 RepID=A0AAD5SAF3_9FUNG|nr:DEAH (Asp-Glu-Ala-His) box polypeptide 34 [Rhizophlyctis rosea]